MALIYILEDDKDVCDIESLALKSVGHDTKMFFDAKSFLDELMIRVPDLAVIDVMLPDRDGYDVVEKIRETDAFYKLPILMVTAKTKEFDLIKGIETGADDYLKKPFSVMEFITRVKSLLRRTVGKENIKGVVRIGGIVLDDARRKVYVNDEIIELTYKEYELLKYLMNNKGVVMSREQIMGRVWGTYSVEDSRTIDIHIKNIRKKMKNERTHIKTIRSVGYVLS